MALTSNKVQQILRRSTGIFGNFREFWGIFGKEWERFIPVPWNRLQMLYSLFFEAGLFMVHHHPDTAGTVS
jgi:hypothetical protein